MTLPPEVPMQPKKLELDLKAEIRAEAERLGFCDVGFAPAGGLPRWGENLTAFLAEGRHGAMDWLADTADRRARPTEVWPEARSVIVLATRHAAPGPLPPPERGAISAYAQGRDYHDVIKKRLKALGRWLVTRAGGSVRPYCDTAPVMEKPLAEQAGLGWQGRHTLLVSPRAGGWLLLGALMSDLALPPDPPERNRCGSCRACVAACPTGALEETGRIDPRRCLSYYTIEGPDLLPEALRPALGNRIYGCDACQAACPWTQRRAYSPDPALAPRPDSLAPALAELAMLDEAGFRARFAGTPVKRVGRDRFVATVLIAIANSGRRELHPLAEQLRDDPAEPVRTMAAWACLILGREGAGELG